MKKTLLILSTSLFLFALVSVGEAKDKEKKKDKVWAKGWIRLSPPKVKKPKKQKRTPTVSPTRTPYNGSPTVTPIPTATVTPTHNPN